MGKPNSEDKYKIEPVLLEKISPHELYDDYCELMATADYMLSSAGILTNLIYISPGMGQIAAPQGHSTSFFC